MSSLGILWLLFLQQSAPPRITIPDKNIIISKENVLSCAVSGFYPVDIDIKWLRDGIILNNIKLERPQRDPGGMYSVRSSVTITPTEEDRKRIFSCRIQHESLTTPLQEDFQLVYGDSTDTKSSTLYTIVIPVIAGVVILILIAVVAKFCVKRKKGQNKHHEDNLENQKENLLANNPSGLTPFPSQSVNAAGDPTPERSQMEDVSAREETRFENNLPNKPQDCNTNSKSVTEKSNNQDKSQINNESSEAALLSSAHGPTGKSDLVSERQKSCSERSGTQQAPVYSNVFRAPVHHTSVTGPEPVPAAIQSNSHITSPPGTKDPRTSIDMHTRDSGRGQAAQQHRIGNLGGVNSAKSATKNWSIDSTRSPVYQKTTSPECRSTSPAVSPAPKITKQFTDKKTEPSNQENSESMSVADLKLFFEKQK